MVGFGDDSFGQIPRKKVDPPSSTLNPHSESNNSMSLTIPRKKSITVVPSSDTLCVPLKKKRPIPGILPSTDSNAPKSSFSSKISTSVANAQQGLTIPMKLDRGTQKFQRTTGSSNQQNSLQNLSYASIPRNDQERHQTEASSMEGSDRFRLSSNERFQVISENPLILKINVQDVPMISANRNRISRITAGVDSSSIENKKKRSIYQELEDTDNEDFMTPDEEREMAIRKSKKRLKKKIRGNDEIGTVESNTNAPDHFSDEAPLDAYPENNSQPNDDGVPPGVLTSLWYSQERFLNLFVLDKICGWKRRQKVFVHLESDSAETIEELPQEKQFLLDAVEAFSLQQQLLANPNFFLDVKGRMEVSRINPTHCPVVMTFAAATCKTITTAPVSQSEDCTVMCDKEKIDETNSEKKKYKVTVHVEREEVLLVKWRGRSYLHNSWERATDIQRLDPSANFTARSKIRRFYQNQETKLGLNWRNLLDEERKSAAALHGQVGIDLTELVDSEPIEEYFSPQCLEIERIIGCDENTMNMEVLGKQRAINIRNEQEAFKEKEKMTEESKEKDSNEEIESQHSRNPYLLLIKSIKWAEVPAWDPEDNVRYIVKWKELPYAESTWEYWKDIKRDAVDEVEDFWYRQQPPDLEEATRLANKPHPQMKDFKKLSESRAYGVSKKRRPIYKLVDDENKESGSKDDDEVETDPGFRLRGYQLEGVNWLLFNWWNKRSCILADEMGLGKTIQSAAFLQELQSQPGAEIRGPFLIVAPLSLIGQWQSELASWAPDMNVILYHGSADAREYMVKEEFYYTEQFVPKQNTIKLKRQHVTKFHVLITTYEVVLKDSSVLSKIRWRALLVDEAHRLKNSSSKLFDELAAVPRDFCVLLTGTPIANATEELWALLHFANPHMFAEKDEFQSKFGEMTDAKQVNELHNLLKPYLLRRVKEDVEKSLPPKEETILEVSLTPIQKTFYKAIYERNTSFLFKGAKPNNAPSLMNVMMELRKCCNHPFLVKGAEERILNDAAAKLTNNAEESGVPHSVDYVKLFVEQLVKSSGKMVLMEKLLEKLFTDGHKVLIFSQMVRVLDLLEELLKIKKYRYERLDGSTSSSSRVHAVERFKRKSLQRFVMLLSTRAGGLGLNLTAASVVIIFDSDWNPQNDLQAMARAHRIGQTKAVRVYRFLTAKTYEMHMFHSASLKLGLERAVLSQNREQSDDVEDNKSKRKTDKEAQAKEIDELLKKGAYDVFRDDDDAEGEKFMETDIDQLLEQSSKKITYGANASTSLSGGLGSFSKASFVANTEDGAKDVDLDDPDFWSKAIGLEVPQEVPEEIASMIDDGVKRSRKQVQAYDPYAETAEAEQRKKDKIALEKQVEKEEKERVLAEKKRKKRKEERRKMRALEQSGVITGDKNANQIDEGSEPSSMSNQKSKHSSESKDSLEEKRKSVDTKLKKSSKKDDRVRALKRAENENPLIERIKQAWEAPHRNRGTAAVIRFGFGRFCKIRNEANLGSLPLQDLESFTSSYIYQLSVQFLVTLLSRIPREDDIPKFRTLIQEWLGACCAREVNWMCESVQSAMKFQIEVESGRRFLRMPLILAEPTYVADLRRGAAFRALRRIGILNRLNCIVEEELDTILSGLGHEELGKRGCGINGLSSLDADLKSRYVTTEELLLAIGSKFKKVDIKPPSSWWDRSCDVGLIVGSFVHGLGNYEAMRNDSTLPFGEKIRHASQCNVTWKSAMQNFRASADAARRAFDDALESARVKAELEVQAAVAAAAKAASKREKDATLLRKGGLEAEVAAKNMPETQVENAFEFDGTDSHFVTLRRIHEYIHEALGKEPSGISAPDGSQHMLKNEDYIEALDDGTQLTGREKEHHFLPMPDARVLDYRVIRVLEAIESFIYGDEGTIVVPDLSQWPMSAVVKTNSEMRTKFWVDFIDGRVGSICEYRGVGLGGSQCGTSHRSLNDGSDYAFGAASNRLSQVAYGTDAPRFLRAIGVPMNITRFALTALSFADVSNVKGLLSQERMRCYGKEKESLSEQFPAANSDGSSADAVQCAMESVSDKTETPDISSSMHTVDLIPKLLREDSKLRAAVCMTVLFYGYPCHLQAKQENCLLWKNLLLECDVGDASGPKEAFGESDFRSMVCSHVPDSNVPHVTDLRFYVESILLPYCLSLCVNGNGPATRNARGSHGEYETAFGVSIHPEPSLDHPSPIPDPCMTMQEHSLEAVGMANAILRRVRLLRACQSICFNEPFMSKFVSGIVRSPSLSRISDLPVWWCPHVHDVALLVQAATGGLFSVLLERSSHLFFSSVAIQRHLKVLYNSKQSIPESSAFSQDSWNGVSSEVRIWIERKSNQFPTLYQLERRLALLCSEATTDTNDELRFHNLPMFDHGGWPRN